MLRILFVSKDLGNAKASSAVARQFAKDGWEVTYALDATGKAYHRYDEGDRSDYDGCRVVGAPLIASLESLLCAEPYDAACVTLSASGKPNLELDAVRVARNKNIPVFGIEEVVGGRHNPGWEKGDQPFVRQLTRIFTAMPTEEDGEYPNVDVVGPPQLARYRDVDIRAFGLTARRKLEINVDQPVIYYSGHPELENPHALSRVGEALARVRTTGYWIDKVVLVVSRHSRDKDIPDNPAAHRHTLRLIEQNVGIRVIENSLDHKDFPVDHLEAIPNVFRPREFATYQELVCACASNGVIVTGFGTDGQVIAPCLGIPSVLYIDAHQFHLGEVLWREKKLHDLPLAYVPKVSTVQGLADALGRFLFRSDDRARHCKNLEACFGPYRTADPAGRIVTAVEAYLAGHTVAS